MERLAALLLSGLLLLACGEPGTHLRLSIGAEPEVGALDRLEARVKTGSGSGAAVLTPYVTDLDDRDLATDPWAVGLEIPAGSDLAGSARLIVLGSRGGAIVASGVLDLDLDGQATQEVTLALIERACDQDGDGFLDCNKAGCCEHGEDEGFADCDDGNGEAHPFADSASCRACEVSCGASTADEDATEPGPEVVETSDTLPAGDADVMDVADGTNDVLDVVDAGADQEDGAEVCAPQLCVPAEHPEIDLGPCERLIFSLLTCACEVKQRPQAAPCDDGDPCTVGEACDAEARCVGTEPEGLCDDGNPCTDDACVAMEGCAHTNNTKDCDDGNPCTLADQCAAGACVGGAHDPACGSCDPSADTCEDDWGDSDACNGTLRCVAGQCVVAPETAITCDTSGDSACLYTACDPGTGFCVPKQADDGTACSDDNACTSGDACADGTCVGVFDDGIEGCLCSLEDGFCEEDFGDGDLCNGVMACQEKEVLIDETPVFALVCALDEASVPAPCDPTGDTACMKNRCQPVSGACTLMAVADGLPCDDGDPCTLGDACGEGVCVSAVMKACDDGDPCTVDACDAESGACTYTLQPIAEMTDLCDGVDDDCDGETDEDYVETETTCGVGACEAAGQQVCQEGGQEEDTCVPNEAATSDEVCDGIDNDCDGLTDAEDSDDIDQAGFLLSDMPVCSEQRGLCEAAIKPASLCVQGAWLACTAAEYQTHAPAYSADGTDATCDELDNDCDGETDEDCSPETTRKGVGWLGGAPPAANGPLEHIGGFGMNGGGL